MNLEEGMSQETAAERREPATADKLLRALNQFAGDTRGMHRVIDAHTVMVLHQLLQKETGCRYDDLLSKVLFNK